MPAIRVRTSTGWQDLIITGPGSADATAAAKGIVQLAGDLGGTAALPTVPKLASSRYQKIVRNANASAGNDYTVATSAGVYTAVDSTNMRITMVCTGRPVRVQLRGMCANNVAMGSTTFQLRMDGAVIDGGPQFSTHSASAGQQLIVNCAWDVVPSAASHYFEPWWTCAGTSATCTLYCRAVIPVQFTVEELPYG